MSIRDGAELIDRIWERDPTVWTGADEAKWLGWLDEPRRMAERAGELETFADAVDEERLDAVVLLGMGGSSLAPEVLRRTFRVESFHVLDTTHPQAIRQLEETIELERTLFVSASKSGGTLETIRAFQDHGEIRGDTLREGIDEAWKLLDQLREAGVDYDDVTDTLEEEGVQKFADSFEELLDGIRAKRSQLAAA